MGALGLFVNFAAQIMLFIVYALSIKEYTDVSPSMIKFIVDNKCSDSVLQHAFEQYYE